MPHTGPGTKPAKPRYVPLTQNRLWCMGWCSDHWTPPARAWSVFRRSNECVWSMKRQLFRQVCGYLDKISVYTWVITSCAKYTHAGKLAGGWSVIPPEAPETTDKVGDASGDVYNGDSGAVHQYLVTTQTGLHPARGLTIHTHNSTHTQLSQAWFLKVSEKHPKHNSLRKDGNNYLIA